MNVTINEKNLGESIFDEIFATFEEVDSQLNEENEAAEIDHFTMEMVDLMKSNSNQPK